MLPNQQNRSRSSSPEDHTSRKSSRGNSLTRMRHASPPLPATSLLQRIVGPLKSSITKKCKTAGELIESSDHAIKLFEDPHAEHITTHQQELEETEEILRDLHKTSDALQNLGEYITTKFSDPEMQASPEKEDYMLDVKNHLVQMHVDDIIMLINHNADKLEIILATNKTSIDNISPNPEDSTMSDDRNHGEEHHSPDENTAHNEDTVPLNHRDSDSSQSSTYHETSSDLPNQPQEPISNNESMLKQAETGNRRLQEEVQRLKLNNEKKLLAQMATERQRLELEKDRLLRQETQMVLAEARSKRSSNMLANNEHTAKRNDPIANSVQTQSNQNIAKDANVQTVTAPIAPTPTSQPNQSIKDNKVTQANQSSQEMLFINAMNKLSSIESTQNKTNNAIFANWQRVMLRWKTLKEIFQRIENQETRQMSQRQVKSNRTKTRNRSRSHSHLVLTLVIEVTPISYRHQSDTLVKHIKAFDGTGKLDIFEKTFANTVMKHPRLNDDMRYSILTTLVKGEAAPCIDQSTDSKLAIDTTLSNLRNVYGKCNDKYNFLDRLKKLPFHQSSTKQMRLDIAAHTVVLGLLREKDMPENDEPTIHIIVGKLPPAMRQKIASYLTKMGSTVTQNQVLQRIRQCIDYIEMENTIISQTTPVAANEVPTDYAAINYTKASPSTTRNSNGQPLPNANKPRPPPQLAYNPNAYSNQFYDTATKVKLDGIFAPGEKGVNLTLLAYSFPFENEEVNRCAACDGLHNPIRCPLSSSAFRQAAKERGLCPICNSKHDITKCKSHYRCGYCSGLHHMGGCPKKEYYRDLRNYPKEARPIVKFFRTGSKVPNSVPTADLPTAISNTYSLSSTPIPLETAPTAPEAAPIPLVPATVVDHSSLKLSHTVVTSVIEEYDINRFVQFVSRTSPPHHITTAKAADINNRLTFMCLETPDNQHILALVDSGASLSLILESKAKQLRLAVLKETRLSIQGFDSQTTNDSHIFAIKLKVSDTRVPLAFMIAGSPILPNTAYNTSNCSTADKKFMLDRGIEDPSEHAHPEHNGKRIDMILGNDMLTWMAAQPSYRKHILPSKRSLGAAIINKDIDHFVYSNTLTQFLATTSITCRYITPLAPWQGGIYERIVQLVKRQVLKECGSRVYEYHDLSYVISGAQGMINNRPLIPHARSPGDLIALRPIDFINPGVMTEIPSDHDEPPNPTGVTEASVRAHLNNLEATLERVWKLWSIGYLTFMREAMHQNRRCSTLVPEVGQLVIISVNLLKRHKWPLGVITKVNKSARDGQVRSATVMCRGTLVERPVCQLIPLELTSLNHQCNKDMSEDIKSNDAGISEKVEPGLIEDTNPKTALPTPATLESLDITYAPELFPTNVFPNIAAKSANHPAEKGTAEDEPEDQKQSNKTQIGTSTNPENLILEDAYSPEDGVYQDPQNTLPDIARDYGAEILPEGRSRDYHPRRAKATHINYVHTADMKILSRPSPPECCQLYHALHTFDNLKAL
ncbi:hypothetical protein CRE_06158 [Caenorhabditis remanei]|uniref:DUF5641 domain-containing protein n=1 Tax=Caenorhabditis remanei TaxID=31234 RepID=E3NGW0_CAERE|nr:hypothetical protein CRE_06158 [Caenorhabditis remanei]